MPRFTGGANRVASGRRGVVAIARLGLLTIGLVGCHAEPSARAPSAHSAGELGAQWLEQPTSRLEDLKTITDLSFLNSEAAGAHGFVRGAGGHFVDDRGARLRFFGINLTGIACLPDPDNAARLARHFRKLGFNAVRLHALDAPGALVDSAGLIQKEPLNRLDFFVSELKSQGIYVSLSLHTASGYAGLDSETLSHFPAGRVLDRFHQPFLDAQRDFARQLLSHENAFTHHTYGDEPAVLYVELVSEDTIFPSWAGSPDDAPASFRAELTQRYAPWLVERTAAGLRAPGPALEEAAGALPTFHDSAAARADYAEFLRATELDAARSLTTFVRHDLGLHSMVIDTQASFGGLPGVLREADVSDFIDMHGYWDPPRSTGDASNARWSIRNTSQIEAADAGTLGVLASYRVFGKPFSVSEYASPAPNEYAEEELPLLIGVAGLQDWDAVFAFAYADHKRDYTPGRINGVFDIAGHPGKLAFITMAASAFRRGLVAPGPERVELRVPDQPRALPYEEDALPSLWSQNGVPQTAVALRQLGITIRPGSGEASASYALHVEGALGSDTGQLLWDSQGPHARFSIDAPALKAVCGVLANSLLNFQGVSFEFHDFSPDFACASLLSLDDQPIASARRLLLTVVGRSQNAHLAPTCDPNTVVAPGAGPALAQYVPITLTLPRDGWHAEALDAAGTPLHSLPVVTTNASTLSTAFQGATLSYSITR